MTRSRKYKLIERSILIGLVTLFFVFMMVWETHLTDKEFSELVHQARVIENDLWNYDDEGSVVYLELAARLNNYESLTVYDVNNKLFSQVKGPKSSRLDQAFIKAGLIKKIPLKVDISYNDTLIGRIEAVRYHDPIYLYLYLLLVIGLIMLGLRFYFSSLRDFTELKKADEKLKTSLEEKELLLREIHHRVKNNMQVVSSLIGIQKEKMKSEVETSVLNAFLETENRIKSMALVHEKLYGSHDFSRVDFASYARQLAKELFQAYEINSEQVKLETRIERIQVDINKAVPCGLILNELLSNALKYAFPGNRRGTVSIALKQNEDGMLVLSVCDDGIGIPEGADVMTANTMGMLIVNALIGQLDAKMVIERNDGTSFHIRFAGY